MYVARPKEAPFKLAMIGQGVAEKFENNSHIHVHVQSPAARADNLLRLIIFPKHKSCVNLDICCNFFSL